MSEKVAICSGCGVIPADEFGSHICKPRDLTAKLAEMRERHIKKNHQKGSIPYCDEVVAFQALEAVLAMPEQKHSILVEPLWNDGYNQALADVRATIEGKVGNGH